MRKIDRVEDQIRALQKENDFLFGVLSQRTPGGLPRRRPLTDRIWDEMKDRTAPASYKEIIHDVMDTIRSLAIRGEVDKNEVLQYIGLNNEEEK